MNVDQSVSNTPQLEDRTTVNEVLTAKSWMENVQAQADLRPDLPSRSR